MAGIVSYGSYIPTIRIDRKIIAEAWGRGAVKGERSVANNDEDSITMAVEAGLNTIHQMDRNTIDGLFFATTTSPYIEKMNTSLIATAMDLGTQIVTSDFTNSMRSGTAALRAALASVTAKNTKKHLVAAADQRLSYPKSDDEQMFGDAAAAILLGDDDIVAEYEGDFSVCHEIMDIWRTPEDKYVKTWEKRFVLEHGITANIKKVVKGILEKYNVKPEDIAKIIIPAPDSRTCMKLAKSLGFNPETQVQDLLLMNVGLCGTAHPLIMLVNALETANPCDLILLTSYGDGADAFLFRATDNIKKKVNRKSLAALIQNKIMLTAYGRFLSYKNVVEPQPGEPFRLMPSATATYREQPSTIRCHGSKCRKCGCTAFPIQRICYNCRSRDEYEEVRLSDKTGKMFTFTRDNMAGRSDDPVVVQAVVDLEGDIRFYGLMTDCDPAAVELEQEVEMTFRKFYDGAGFHNYYWKLRPVVKEGV